MADNIRKNATTKSPAVKPPVAICLRAAVGHPGMGLNHSQPEELAGAHLDVVLAQEAKRAVIGDAEQRKAARPVPRSAGSIRCRRAHGMSRDEEPTARIDVKGAAVDAGGIDRLNPHRFAAPRIDRKHRDRILTADGHTLAPHTGRRGGAIGDINGLAVGMDVHGAGGLKHSALARAGQGTPFAHEMRGRSVESKLGDPVLRLQHDISPGLRRVEIEVARTETVIAAGRDDNPAS